MDVVVVDKRHWFYHIDDSCYHIV